MSQFQRGWGRVVRLLYDPQEQVHAPLVKMHNGGFVPCREHPGRIARVLVSMGHPRGQLTWVSLQSRRFTPSNASNSSSRPDFVRGIEGGGDQRGDWT